MWILQNYPVWLFRVCKVGEILLFAKAKSSKNFFRFYGIAESLGKLWFKGRKQSKSFYALCVKFWEFVESMADSAI